MKVVVNAYYFSGRIAESREFAEFHSDEFDSYLMELWVKLEKGSIRQIQIIR
jgi:hypothetical protein